VYVEEGRRWERSVCVLVMVVVVMVGVYSISMHA
jgi:hypothetical protein